MWDTCSLAPAFLGSSLASYPGWLLEWPGYEARLSPSGCLTSCNATCCMWQKLGRNLRMWRQQQPTSAFIHYTFQWLLHKQTVLHRIDVFFCFCLFVCLFFVCFFLLRVRNKFTETIPGSRSVGIRLRSPGNTAYLACLPLLCQGSKWLNGNSVWLVLGWILEFFKSAYSK